MGRAYPHELGEEGENGDFQERADDEGDGDVGAFG